MRGLRTIGGAFALAALLVAASVATGAAPDGAEATDGRAPYGVQRLDATELDSVASNDATTNARRGPERRALWLSVVVLGAALGALLLWRRARPARAAREAPTPAAPRRAADDAARAALEAARQRVDDAPREASNAAAHALREYGMQYWVADLGALTTPEIEAELAAANTPGTTREFVRILARYDAERFQDAANGALETGALRACIDASLRFVDDTAARLAR